MHLVPTCTVSFSVCRVCVLTTAACLVIACIIFASDNGNKWDREKNLLGIAEYYDWGFVVAIIAAICSAVATLAMGFVICCTRND